MQSSACLRRGNLGAIITCGSKDTWSNRFEAMGENYFHDVESGMQKEMIHAGYGLMTERIDSMVENATPPPMLSNGLVDGILVMGGMFNDSVMQMLQQQNLPIVVIGRDWPGLDCVMTDYTECAYLGIRHLLERGHREILYISGPDRTPTSRLKDIGFKKALEEFSMQPNRKRYTRSEFSGEGGYWAVKTAYELNGVRPTAIFTAADTIAAGAMGYLYEQKLRVPDDVSIVSYESSMLTEYLTPRLTSIDVHKEELGRLAVQMMVRRLENPDLPRQYQMVKADLRIGASVKDLNL